MGPQPDLVEPLDLQSWPLQAEIIESDAGFDALEGDWSDLIRRAPPQSATQSFAYNRAAWRFTSQKNECRLAIVAIRSGPRLVGLWPLYVRRRGGLGEATHLGCGANEEYAGPIIAAGGDARTIAAFAIRTARSLADVLRVYNLEPSSITCELLSANGGFCYRSEIASPIVELAQAGSWDAWIGQKSKNFRHEIGKYRRRLTAAGKLVSFNSQEAGADIPALMSWIFERKRAWAHERKIRETWVYGSHGEELFQYLVKEHPETFVAFGMTLDGSHVAGGFGFLSPDKFEFHVVTFDEAFAYYSPGNLITEDVSRWSLERGVDMDFRVTQMPYKARWAGHDDLHRSFIIACRPAGYGTVARLEAVRIVRRVRQALAPYAKAALKQVRGPRKPEQ